MPFETPEGWDRDAVNRTLLYHGELAHALTVQRTALESALIPVTAYILTPALARSRPPPDLRTASPAWATPHALRRRGRSVGGPVVGRPHAGGAAAGGALRRVPDLALAGPKYEHGALAFVA